MAPLDSVFIHVPRTGGNTIRDVFPVKNYQHYPATTIRDLMGPRWSDSYGFGFIRNPWDRLVSFYYRERYTDPIAFECFREDLDWQRQDLADWFDTNACPLGHVWFAERSPRALLADENGVPLVHIFRFEHFERACSEIADRFFITLSKVPRRKASQLKKYPYRLLIVDKELRDRITDHASWEIDRFGYRF